MKVFATPTELVDQVGTSLGDSGFRRVDQIMIDSFAEVTGDRQWIHVDPDRARSGPFGAPIAHGMLVLSMAVDMLTDVFVVDGADLVVNKGFDRVRFAGPVPAGARVRLAADLLEARARPRGFIEAVLRLTLEVAGDGRPAYTANLRLLYHSATAANGSGQPVPAAPHEQEKDRYDQATDRRAASHPGDGDAGQLRHDSDTRLRTAGRGPRV